MEHDIERRIQGGGIELRAGADGKAPVIVLRPIVFGQRSVDLGGFVEIVDPGAVTKALEADDIMALWQHRGDQVLGRTASKTMRASADKTGVVAEIDAPDTQLGRDVVTLIKRGDVSGASFGFRTVRDRWETLADKTVLRTLLEVRLFDFSPVTFPAYPQTTAAMRSLQAWEAEKGGGEMPDERARRRRRIALASV